MRCVTIDSEGYIVDVPQPARYTECALVIASGSEYAASPFVMTLAEGAAIGTAIATVWITVGVITRVSRRI